MPSSAKSLVRSLQRGLQIINVVAADGPMHAKSVARTVRLPLPTAYHLLRTLVHDGYLVRLQDGSYVLGERCRADNSSGSQSRELQGAAGLG